MVTKLAPGSFFGRAEGSRTLAGITVLESHYSPGSCVRPHEHATAFFDLVVEGACTETLGGRTRARARSSVAFHPAGEVHSSRWHGARPRCFHVEIPARLMDVARQYSPLAEAPAHFAEAQPCWLAARLYGEFRRPDGASPLVIEGLALELLAECGRRPPGPPAREVPPWLGEVRGLLHEEFSGRLTLDGLAAAAGVHPAHLARVFRRLHGCTVGDYVRRLRVEFACRRLADSDAPLAEIALAAGFADQSHFSNTFRRCTGTSPAEFRRSARPRKSGAREGSPGTRP